MRAEVVVPAPSLSTSRFQGIKLGMESGSSSLAIGPFLPVHMPNGFLATGSVSKGAGFGFPGIGDTGESPDGRRLRSKWEREVSFPDY